ncbi:hypothetical protein [Nonomuraea sp. bgisy101]|uniref:hypothetical protein n=1 Tax=Nonomuraea sp. bgisy101 TaxID=3413784 RepID=UPI003D71A24E
MIVTLTAGADRHRGRPPRFSIVTLTADADRHHGRPPRTSVVTLSLATIQRESAREWARLAHDFDAGYPGHAIHEGRPDKAHHSRRAGHLSTWSLCVSSIQPE